MQREQHCWHWVVAHVVEEEVVEVREEVIVNEDVAASSRESALPKFQ